MAENKKFVLVIDAGHGGHDSGAVGAFSKEKNINLNTALAFGRLVEANCSDVKVIYTRKTDVFIPLHERANIANKNHADVFISVHTNSVPAGNIARGFETYTMGMRRSDEKLSAAQRENSVITIEKDYEEHYQGYDPNSPESAIMFEFMHDSNMSKSVELAKLVQKEVCASANRPDKGVKQDVFLVLRETSMPACLIELGFISTPDEETMLNDPSAIERFARGIYNAFIKYKNKNDHTGKKYSVVANDEQPKADSKTQPKSDTKTADIAAVDNKSTKYEIPSTDRMSRSEAHRLRQEKEAQQQTTKTDQVAQQPSAITKSVVEEVKPVEKKESKSVEKKESKPVEKKEAKPTEKKETKESKPAQTASPTNIKASELANSSKPKAAEVEKTVTEPGKPVFKVQFLTNNKVLRPDSQQLKGVTGASYYRDGNAVKYTIGECSTYQEADQLKKTITDKFPDAFIVSFLGGERIDLSVARKMVKN